MFKCGLSPLLAGYVVQARVVPDWWHPFRREDIGQAGQDRLEVVRGAIDTVEDTSQKGRKKGDNEKLTLYECNALVGTFTSQHNAADLGLVLHYIRNTLQQDLTSYHTHSLFRVFNHQQDRENVLQLLEVITSNGESTPETYARALDHLHCTAPVDVLERALQVVQLAETAFGSLVFHPSQGSELATVAAFGTGPENEEAVADPDQNPGTVDGTTLGTAPVLSSLLHHLANTLSTPLGAVLVAVWIRALGVPLSDWDYVSLFSSVLSHSELFPQLRQTTELFSAFPRGVITLQALFDKLEKLGWCKEAESPIAQVVAAMRRSLTAAGVDLLARIEVGVINTQTSTLEAYLAQLLAHAERRPGLGPYRFNTSVLHHTLSLLHSVVGDDVQATRQLTRALASESRWESTYGDGRSAAVLTPSAEEEVGEPFQVSPLHIIDVGHLLPRLTAHSLAEVKDPFTVLVKKMEVEANQYQLVSSTVPLLSVERRLADIPTLAVPPRRPSTVDALTVGGYATLFLNSPEEAREALKRAVATIDPSRPRLYRTTRHLFKQYAQLCAMHPPRNRKLTQTGYEERKKWGSYLEARDIALGLFGSAQHARDVMKEIFYNDGELHRLRSPEVVERDCNDVSRIFFPEFASEKVTGEGSAVWSNTAKWHKERTTQPHLRCPSSAVPRHLWDTSVYNPYPHLSLGRSPLEHDPFLDGDDAADLFPDLWNVLTNPSVMGADKWYVQNTDMYVLLMRCLLYRLDWEAAVELTTRMLQHSTYTFLVDHEITMIFRDIGDPAGCLAFKVAAKLFDGRITRDGQTKREKYHDEQLR